jgi:hypothetical protein
MVPSRNGYDKLIPVTILYVQTFSLMNTFYGKDRSGSGSPDSERKFHG